MRLDRFLKVSRIVKRRSAAQEMISHGAVRVGRAEVRPAKDLKPGDIVEVAFPRKIVTFRVTSVEESAVRRGEGAFEILEERIVTGEERPW
ncbi:MAG: S4 domain-containing protein [Thermovirgaceae bacterium]|nr:S4 domain-containing protein [Thermovirgaceae bacterium]